MDKKHQAGSKSEYKRLTHLGVDVQKPMPEEIKKKRDEQADTVSFTAARPMLRDMLSMSRGEFKNNLDESYRWGFNAAWALALEIVGPTLDIYEKGLTYQGFDKKGAPYIAVDRGEKARECKKRLGL